MRWALVVAICKNSGLDRTRRVGHGSSQRPRGAGVEPEGVFSGSLSAWIDRMVALMVWTIDVIRPPF
jgi:hypothetical protein